MRTGQSRRRDENEWPIICDLRKLGYHVTQVSGVGAPDLIVRRSSRTGFGFSCEVKSSHGKRTGAQERSQWPIVRSLDDILRLMGGL